MAFLEHFSFYRDYNLEAFYNLDVKYRRRIIAAFGMIFLLPLAIAALLVWEFTDQGYTYYVLGFSIFLYLLVVIETISYLYSASRKLYKKYFFWVMVPLVGVAIYGGFRMGVMFMESSSSPDINYWANFGYLLASFGGVFGVFLWTQFGISNLLKASRALYKHKAAIEADVRFAAEVQDRILKDVTVENNGSRGYGCSLLANELGGDYFELFSKDRELIAAIGDVSGHSFGAGLLMAMTKGAIQTHLEYSRSPSQIMEKLNKLFYSQAERKMFATMMLLKLDLSSNRAYLCNAGHYPVLHFVKETGDLKKRYLQGVGLGLSENTSFSSMQFEVQKGDLLVLYTDGLVETRDKQKNVRDDLFFEQLVNSSIQESYDTPQELTESILRKVKANNSAKEFEDDRTLILLEV